MSEKLCASESDDDDDDEPLLSSPDSSCNENEVNDVFHYTARKFQKVNHRTGPSPARRRRHHVDAIQTKLSALEHQQQARDRKLRNCLKIDLDDSSDDDEDDEVAMAVCNKTATRSRAQVAKESTAKDPPPPRAVTAITIDISDDSDDEVNASRLSWSALKQAPREVLEVLQKSQQATNRLQRAQLYHAEDVEVQVDSNVNVNSNTNSHGHSNANINLPRRHNCKQAEMHLRLGPSVTKPIKPPLGKKIQLTCRCQLKLNGNNQPTLEKNIAVHEHQDLSALMEKVFDAFSLPSTARVALFFDGLLLDTKRTAASYEMEDSDLVDINASVIAMPPTNAAVGSSGPGPGPRLSLTLRSKVDSKVHETSIQLGKNEVFQTLLDQYVRQQNICGKCVLHFDGEALGLDRTPSNYDMEDGDLIDVVR